MAKKPVTITLDRLNRQISVSSKSNLLRTLQSHQVPIGSACGGQGVCASCKVSVLKGAENLSQKNDIEIDLAERNNLAKNERISCQCQVLGDIEITTGYW